MITTPYFKEERPLEDKNLDNNEQKIKKQKKTSHGLENVKSHLTKKRNGTAQMFSLR